MSRVWLNSSRVRQPSTRLAAFTDPVPGRQQLQPQPCPTPSWKQPRKAQLRPAPAVKERGLGMSLHGRRGSVRLRVSPMVPSPCSGIDWTSPSFHCSQALSALLHCQCRDPQRSGAVLGAWHSWEPCPCMGEGHQPGMTRQKEHCPLRQQQPEGVKLGELRSQSQCGCPPSPALPRHSPLPGLILPLPSLSQGQAGAGGL